VSVHESSLFAQVKNSAVSRGQLKLLFSSPDRLCRYLFCILLGLPIWYTVGILVTLCPEIAAAMGATGVPSPGLAVSWTYVGLFFGDMAGGLLSQYLGSRKRALAVFLLGCLLLPVLFLRSKGPSVQELYAWFVVLGFFAGYWVLVITVAAEQFGTNIRATATTTVPNFIRGAVVPMTMLFTTLKSPLGVISSAELVGVLVSGLALVSLMALRETFEADLDYVDA
jgi:hypothetical protein